MSYEYPRQEELYESYVISDSGPLGSLLSVHNEGKCLCDQWNDWDEVISAITKDMDEQNYWPGIYYVNDHGNLDILDYSGNILQSWV